MINEIIDKIKRFFIKKQRTDAEELVHNTLLFHARIFKLKRSGLSRVNATLQALSEKLNED